MTKQKLINMSFIVLLLSNLQALTATTLGLFINQDSLMGSSTSAIFSLIATLIVLAFIYTKYVVWDSLDFRSGCLVYAMMSFPLLLTFVASLVQIVYYTLASVFNPELDFIIIGLLSICFPIGAFLISKPKQVSKDIVAIGFNMGLIFLFFYTGMRILVTIPSALIIGFSFSFTSFIGLVFTAIAYGLLVLLASKLGFKDYKFNFKLIMHFLAYYLIMMGGLRLAVEGIKIPISLVFTVTGNSNLNQLLVISVSSILIYSLILVIGLRLRKKSEETLDDVIPPAE